MIGRKGKREGCAFLPPPPPFAPATQATDMADSNVTIVREKQRTIKSLKRLFLVQDMSSAIPLAERITILIEGE